jgi:hypothetical protein
MAQSTQQKKRIMKKKYIAIALTAFLLAAATSATAQFLPPPKPGPGGPANTPIDGGVVALAVAGAAYGYKKLKKNKQAAEDQQEYL